MAKAHATSSSARRQQARAEQERRRRGLERGRKRGEPAPAHWEPWLQTLFPRHVAQGFSEGQRDLWEWAWAVKKDIRPRPLVLGLPRGGGKSTSAELATVALAAREVRAYCWYVRETQDQADKSVENIGALLESKEVERYYPELASRKVGKYGNSKGWRRNRLRTAIGFTIDAIGLDTAARGARVEEQRPDFIIFDDIDAKHDSPAATKRKVEIISATLLPAGSPDAAVLAVQNLIIPDGIFSQLFDGRADFLLDRITSGPYPAVEGLEYALQPDGTYRITSGRATWAGQDLERCQAFINQYGLTAFLSECQHNVEAPPGGMFNHLVYRHCTFDEVPPLERVVVWVDPAVTDTDESDAHGIQADGVNGEGTLYRLYSWEQRASPEDSLRRALLKAVELGADEVGVETNQGGDTWESVYKQAWQSLVESPDHPHITPKTPCPRFKSARAGSQESKKHRASQMLAYYERGKVIHVYGTHKVLERALNRFPKTKPLDLADTSYWSWNDLCGETEKRAGTW